MFWSVYSHVCPGERLGKYSARPSRLFACPDLTIDMVGRQCAIAATVPKEGDVLSLDGNIGTLYPGRLSAVTERPEEALAAIAAWRQEAA